MSTTTTEVTDTERVARAIHQITRWINNLEYNRDQASDRTSRGTFDRRLDDLRSALHLLDGGEDRTIIWLREQG